MGYKQRHHRGMSESVGVHYAWYTQHRVLLHRGRASSVLAGSINTDTVIDTSAADAGQGLQVHACAEYST
jgi:hypothetical protein